MIPQSTISACVKAMYGSNETTDYGKAQAVLLAYDCIRERTTPAAAPAEGEAVHGVVVEGDSIECIADVIEFLDDLASQGPLAITDRQKCVRAAKVIYHAIPADSASTGEDDGLEAWPIDDLRCTAWKGDQHPSVQEMQAAAPAAPTSAGEGEPAAWMHDSPGRVDDAEPVDRPKLPAYGIDTANHANVRVRGYTADQMRAYATLALADAEAALADTQRAIIEAAEQRGYARGIADAEAEIARLRAMASEVC